jgi:hypothetical protein
MKYASLGPPQNIFGMDVCLAMTSITTVAILKPESYEKANMHLAQLR